MDSMSAVDDVEAEYTPTTIVTADEIAATIRQFDGSHTMGAGALGEVIAEEVNSRLAAHDSAVRVAALEEAAQIAETFYADPTWALQYKPASFELVLDFVALLEERFGTESQKRVHRV